MKQIQNHKNKKQSGFTLIELLVVVAIMGLISSIAMTSLGTARKRGRDAKRIGDIRQINTAIQMYIDTTGHAPYMGAMNCRAETPNGGSDCFSITEVQTSEWALLQTDLAPYLPKLPKDPCGLKCGDDLTFFAYTYNPPTAIATFCATVSCNISKSILNASYSIFAQHMELSSPNYVKTFDGYPTYGIINHTLRATSF